MKGGPVLVVAAHPDDEVLGCGGTLHRLAREGREVHVLLLADGETSRTGAGTDRIEARTSAAERAAEVLGCRSVTRHRLPDNRMDSVPLLDVVKLIEEALRCHRPSTLFTHHAGDVNVDHRRAHEAVLAACRPQPGHPVRELFFFEVPSSTEWRPPHSGLPFLPSCFVEIPEDLPAKLEALRAYGEELRPFPHPRSLEAVEALARWRGASVGCAAAEAFETGRLII